MFNAYVTWLFTVKAQSTQMYFKSMQEAKQLHAHIITTGFHQQDLSLRKLITFFAISNPSSLNYARLIFDQIENPSTFIYNTMIRVYSTSSEPQQALHLYNQMHKNGLPPDKYTFPFLLKSCSSLFHHLHKGQETHCQIIKHGFDSNIFVQNSLIHLYGSNAKIDAAHQVFDEMSERDIATWTTLVSCYANLGSITMARKLFDKMPCRSTVSFSAMISGYVRKGWFNEALELFRDLQIEGLEPNDSMIMGVICACANLGTLDNGRWIHSYIRDRKENKYDSRITTALLDMYFKCGSIQDAINVFVGAKEKHVGEWTAMISGMSMHGLGERSIGLFEDMVRSGVKPNVVTFVALLSGCSHGGLVNEGLIYFERMKSEFGIEPTVEHYGCVVDFLGRAGLIDRAMKFLKEIPVEANAAMWGSLLNACRVYKNVEVGEFAARWLVKEEPWNGGVYMTLMSLYKEAGRWEDVENVKNEMKKVGCKKNPGCSLIEVNGIFNEFVVGDKSHPLAFEMCIRIGEMVMEVKEDKWTFYDFIYFA